jgi:hypothetical protein
MSATLTRRVERLQARRDAHGPCEVCGWDSGEPTIYAVEFVDDDDPCENEYCPRCGRQTTTVITWGDEDTPRK